MATIVELVSATDTVTFLATPDGAGYVYDNETLDAWYRMPSADASLTKRPNAHGAYSPGRVWAEAHQPSVVGQYYGLSEADALDARERLAALFSDGNEIVMRVTDARGTTSRTVWVVDFDAPFHYGFDHFEFELTMVAPDPRRYGPAISDTTGLPEASSGLVWDLGTAGSGLYFDWGTAGAIGQVQLTNTGKAATFPRLTIGGGTFAAGFRLTEVETGRELVFERGTVTGEVVLFDSRTQRATIGQGDVTAFLSSREWFEIPAGATRRYQINPLGSVAGSPTLTVAANPAYL